MARVPEGLFSLQNGKSPIFLFCYHALCQGASGRDTHFAFEILFLTWRLRNGRIVMIMCELQSKVFLTFPHNAYVYADSQ